MFPTGRKLTIILIALTALIASGCLEKKTNKRVRSNSSGLGDNGGGNNPWPTPTPTSTPNNGPGSVPYGSGQDNGAGTISMDCSATKPSGNNFNCIRVPSIIARGCKNTSVCPQPIAWKSSIWGGNSELETDQELNIRVIPRPAPGNGTSVSQPSLVGGYPGGTKPSYWQDWPNRCHYGNAPYTLMSMTVSILYANGDIADSYQFDRITTNKASYPYKFTIPGGLNGPVVIQVSDLKWDCAFGGENSTCGMEQVYWSECVKFDLEISTDNTKSWIRPLIQ